jgi:uncharacterized protein YtpQ (UPF0354 family)
MPQRDLLDAVLPQFFPMHWLNDAPDIVFTDFPSRIRVGYVVRADGSYSYVMRDVLAESDISLNSRHASAMENLRKMSLPELTIGKTPGGSEAFLTDVDDNFRAIRILLPNVQEAIAEELGDEYFAAIPCRDWFIAWSKDQSAEWQRRNIFEALDAFLKDDYNLTPDILLYSQGRFSVHLVQTMDAQRLAEILRVAQQP